MNAPRLSPLLAFFLANLSLGCQEEGTFPDDDSTPGEEDDTTPVADDDSTPVADDDSTPVADDDSTPVADDDSTPVADDDSTPVADDDTTPPPPHEDPAEPGPFEVLEQEDSYGSGLSTSAIWIRYPEGPGPYPGIVLSHGFARSPENHLTLAYHLASWGFVVVLPESLSLADHQANGEDLAAIWIPYMIEDSPAAGVVDDARIGLMGHSAGGMATLIGASIVPDLKAVLGLDVTDSGKAGVDAAPLLAAPTAFLAGDPSLCNSDGNGRAVYEASAASPSWWLGITSASHCDFESDTDWLCTLACGSEDEGRQTLIRRYSTAWMLYYLEGDPSLAPWLYGGSALMADEEEGVVYEDP